MQIDKQQSSRKKPRDMLGIDSAPRGVNDADQLGAYEGQPDQFGLIDIKQKDKYEKFYDRIKDDYIFKIENMPEAFEKLEEIETLSEEQERIKQLIATQKSPQTLLMEKFVDPMFLEPDIETGYFSQLNSSFKSSGDDIKKNYVKKMQELLNGREQLSFKQDRFLIKDLYKLVNTYKILEKQTDRQEYLNILRLRSLASQYNSIVPQLKDGFFFPFLIFVVRQGDEQRIIELNFVEDILLDRYKDHCQRSYHFSMIKRVNKAVNEDGFTIEYNNETFSYHALVPGQRDYIVSMIKVAMEEAQIQLRKNRGVNCPENHNLKPGGDKTLTKNLRTVNSLNLMPVMQDYILPHKSLMKGMCRKKNRTIGSEDRYIMLGRSQLLIARDPKFEHIVNVIPMEGSYCICRTEERSNKDTLTLITQQRFFELKFDSANTAANWRVAINLALSKQVKVVKYAKRENIQQRNASKIKKDEQFIICQRDIMSKLKETIKHMADLQQLKKQHPTEIQNLDLEGYQTEIEAEIKKLLKVHSLSIPGANSLQRVTTLTESLLQPAIQSLLSSQTSGIPMGVGGAKTQRNNDQYQQRVSRIPGILPSSSSKGLFNQLAEDSSTPSNQDALSRVNSGFAGTGGIQTPSQGIDKSMGLPKTIVDWRGQDEHVVQVRGPDKFMMSSECHEILLRKIADKQKKASKNQQNLGNSSVAADASDFQAYRQAINQKRMQQLQGDPR